MRFISFTSGSCGNCSYLCPDEGSEDMTGIMIDAGFSMRRMKLTMADKGLNLSDIGAILITHDHMDHMQFLGTFCKYMSIPVCTTRKLHSALAIHDYTKDHIAHCRQVLTEGEWNDICGYRIKWFNVPHDATQTVGYAIRRDGHLLVFMTDLESVPEEAYEIACQADTVVIESNYDYKMLINGPYPELLKRRILDEGHLCNDDCAAAIRKIYHPGLRNIFLCHLSGHNNTPDLAYESASHALESIGVKKGEICLRVLPRGVPSPLVQL